MEPIYVKKADPNDRTTWIDSFIALEPAGGVRVVVEGTQHGSRPRDLAALFSLRTPVRHRLMTFVAKRQKVRS
jgi:hypothetical protein